MEKIKNMEINEEDINNEEGVIVNFKKLQKIVNSGIEKCICKIIREIEINGEKHFKFGTGFFCSLPEKKFNFLITNNHVINEEFLKNEKKLIFEIEEKEKEINLELERHKITNKEFDFTIIEILNKDNINNFLEIDKYINSYDYKDEQIFCAQYPAGNELSYSQGKIIGKNDKYFLYSIGTKGGSSGSPIILFNKFKVIGLHKGNINKENNKINLGIPMNLITNKIYINIIKCIYQIDSDNISINIFSNNQLVNKEIINKVQIIINKETKNNILKYKFEKKGTYKIKIRELESILNMSYMFYQVNNLISIDLSNLNFINLTNMSNMFSECMSLEEINLSNFQANNLTNMSYMFSECKSLKEINL